MPLDFAALIQKYNPKAFDKVLTTQIQKGLQSSRIKNIINYISKLERGYQQEDAISDALEKMLNDDPKRRGILNQVFMDGTFSDSWKYVKVDRRTKEGDELNTLIKNSLGTSDGLTIPFCPNCKAIGQESPLWGYKISNSGELLTGLGLDKSSRCSESELIQKNVTNKEELQSAIQKLTEEQRLAIKSGET